MAALMARLGTPHVEEREPRPMIPTGADANGSDTTAWEPPARAQRGPDDPPGRHLAPLSMWARMDASGDVEAERRMALPEPLAHLPALMAGLRLPEHVAAVRYGSGCRIRRVRVAGRPRKPAGGKRQAVARQHADGGCPAHGHLLDGARHRLDAAREAGLEGVGEAPLLDEGDALVGPPHRPHVPAGDLHGAPRSGSAQARAR